ncbi:Glycosyl transferase family 2 protein [Candidatus Erwinia haradaeae]|uniref:Glycosyl transferase family 2 protein n=1 Tax=Candidatus Erwinia haradaeae TaxID=1922217 RepID=A0A451CZS9_9GAMM|nr:glycosyltransferase family 2 protein [Candidatus Erwinia haradaeae]VFP78532.1 Glycosyl transferase family 2 protein [Candidatus Erwinia haradaeae]
MKIRQKISVVIITRNSAEFLPECLESVNWADEIIILDFNSTDQTRNIACQYGAIVYRTNSWNGYGKQRQIAQSYAQNSMILMIDSDERVTNNLKNSIQNILKEPETDTVYLLSRSNLFLGRFMRHGGWYPDRVIRLYPRHFQYNSNLVHEALYAPKTKIKLLDGDLLHITCSDFYSFQLKQLSHAKAWAIQSNQNGKNSNVIRIFLYTIWTFIQTLLIRASFLDGTKGWILAMVNSQYTFNKYTTLWTLNRSTKKKLHEK